jgi:hypothetical protein
VPKIIIPFPALPDMTLLTIFVDEAWDEMPLPALESSLPVPAALVPI